MGLNVSKTAGSLEKLAFGDISAVLKFCFKITYHLH